MRSARSSSTQGAQEEMTVRDIAAATGLKESTLRQLLKGLAKEGGMCRG
jgi:DNA-binding IclR family transcriptional regulator